MISGRNSFYHLPAYYRRLSHNKIPFHCLFELTHHCNLSCRHCYVIPKKKREITTQEAFRILDMLRAAGCFYIAFSGGEILTRRDFFKIAAYARKLHFALRLFTNATLINAKAANKIASLHPYCVEVSLYGFRKTHDYVTQVRGSFDRTMGGIKLLRNRGVKVLAKSVLMNCNADEIHMLKLFVGKDIGISWRGVAHLISPCDDGNKRPLSLRVDNDMFYDYLHRKVATKGVSSPLIKSFNRRRKLNEPLCGAGFLNCSVTPYGEFNPCVQIKFKNNDLRHNEAIRIWREHKGFKELRRLRIKDRVECRDCRDMKYCFVCPGIVLLETGSLTARLQESCRQAGIFRKASYEAIHEHQDRDSRR